MSNWYGITNKENDTPSIYIYDEIGNYGVTSKQFIDDVRSLGASKINLRINSPGGSVFQALGIYNFLKNSQIEVDTYVEGISASAATIITLAGKKRYMNDSALFMIHNPSMEIFLGMQADSDDLKEFAKELEKSADVLEKVKDQLINIYYDNSAKGIGRSTLAKWMDEEKWMDAKEAKEYGFITDTIKEAKIAAKAQAETLVKKGYSIPDNFKSLLTEKKDNMNIEEKSITARIIEHLNNVFTGEKKDEIKFQDEIQNVASAIKSEYEAKITELENKVVEVEAKHAELATEKETANNHNNEVINGLKDQITSKESEIENLQSQINEMKAKASAPTAASDPAITAQNGDLKKPELVEALLGSASQSVINQMKKNKKQN